MRKSALPWLAAAVMLVGLERLAAGDPAGGPLFLFSVPQGFTRLPADAGTPFHEDIAVFLVTESNPDPLRGAEGYSLSLAAEGVSSTDITVTRTSSADVHDDPPGLRDNGFERSELTSEGAGACAGLSGAVLTVILSQSLPVTLPPEGVELIARLNVEGSYPAKGETLHATIRFVDGCKGSGEPILNRVKYAGSWVEPTLSESRIDLKAWPDCPAPDVPLQMIFQSKGTGQTPGLFAGMAPTLDPAAPAEIVAAPGRATVQAAVVSQLPPEGPGLQGWSFSVSLTGDVKLVGATTAGTVAAQTSDNPPGLRSNGFERTQVVDPSTGFDKPQGQGAVSAVVLSFTEILTLEPRGTATVLQLTLEGKEGQSGQLGWKDGLRGAGGPVSNVGTLEGATQHFDCFQKLNVRFEIPLNPFHRGDVNDDGRIDISDPIRLLGYLFLAASRPPCLDAADFNDDTKLDISDAVSLLIFKFSGGPPPSLPGPPRDPCGVDPEPHLTAGCGEYTHC